MQRTAVPRRPLSAEQAAELLGGAKEDSASILAKRLAEKRHTQRRRLWSRIIAALAAVAIVIGAVWIIFFSSVLALQDSQITVSGADDDIVSVAEVQAKIAPWVGTPLLRIWPGTVEEALLEIPQVKSAEVSWAFPAGLRVAVVPRIVALTEEASQGWAHLDAEGVVLRENQSEVAAGTPIAVITAAPNERGRAASELVQMWSQLPSSIREQVAHIASDGLSMTVKMNSGAIIMWGDSGDGDLKARVLETLMSQREGWVYDVSIPTYPVVS